MNPFNEKSKPIEKSFQNWQQLYPESYDKFEIDPYTKTRIILMNGTEFEANWFFPSVSAISRTATSAGELALTRAVEKQQQIKGSLLKPCNK